MGFKERFERSRPRLLADTSICSANRTLFAEFFEWLAYKLKRRGGLSELDEASFKTLYGYIIKLRNVNVWFSNKPWVDREYLSGEIRNVVIRDRYHPSVVGHTHEWKRSALVDGNAARELVKDDRLSCRR